MKTSIALLGLGALGVGTTIAAETAPLPGKEVCIYQVNIGSWKVLDDRTLLVTAPTGGYQYLIKLFGSVPSLAFQEALGFEDGDHNGQLCSNGDRLHIGGPVPQDMPITAIRSLSAEEAKQLREVKKK
jgi:hypothetical protein